MQYKNPFHSQHYQGSRPVYDNIDPIEHKGFLIFEHTQIEFHIVKNGVCVGMNAGVYTEEAITKHADYYNNGEDSVAKPVTAA